MNFSLLSIFLCVQFLVSCVWARTYNSHWRTQYETQVYHEQECRSYDCGWACDVERGWWWRTTKNCYYRSRCSSCDIVPKRRTISRQVCQHYWTGPACNIPYCDPKCTAGKTCVEGNRCDCLIDGGQGKCKAEACSYPNTARSCYPGTCSGGSACTCPPEFTGPNCQTMLQTPEISKCLVKLFYGTPEIEVASANCAVEGHEPEVTWVAKDSFSRIEAGWEAKYQNQFDPVLPTETIHIKDAKFGVVDTRARVQLNMPSYSPISKDIHVCKNSPNAPEIHTDCSRRSLQWAEIGRNNVPINSTLTVTVSSRLGGFKTLRSGAPAEPFSGTSTSSRLAQFKVDTRRPSHCRLSQSCQDFAILVKEDAVKDPVVNFTFPNWFDHESGIKSYEVEIYELLKSSSAGKTILVRPQNSKDKRTIKDGVNSLIYTFPAPGVYSVELTVLDYANNPSKARKIMLYDKENHMQITNQPFVVEQASPESGYKWITQPLRDDRDGLSRLTLSWKGRYNNLKHLNDGWLSEVQRWNVEGAEDEYKSGGSRTIHEIKNANGTAYYKLAFKVDQLGGHDLKPRGFSEGVNLTASDVLPQSTWIGLGPDVSTKEIVMPKLSPNETIVIWMDAFDVVGYHVRDEILVRFDSSEPEIESAELRQNDPDSYQSSIVIKAKDLDSGIAEVKYHIMDALLKVNITDGVVVAKKLKRSGSTRKRRTLAVCRVGTDTNCYCISGGECFENEITVVIDHCDIDRHYAEDRRMHLHYVVVNQAGRSVKPREPLILKFDGGKPTCRPIVIFTAGTILAILVGLLILIVLIVLAIFMALRWHQHKHPIPDRVRTFASSMKQRITNKEGVLDSEGRVFYRSKTRRGRATEDDDDIYVDGSDPGGWRVNRDQVELAETLAEGRFATVKKAYLKKGGETKPVAAKYLPSGATDSDRALLKAKIAFHGNRVPPHDNIVRLIGVLDEGPVMLLEFCDMTLKDYLSKAGKVTTDVLENLLNFTMQIASGMDHLHSKSIVHRRLAVRNILLKKDGMNGLVAKLIGFGSFDEAGSDEGAAEPTASVAVPLKWLAPETLESVGKGKPVYTQKSDVWAYGVTIWEIYSLGATPYPGKKSAEVEALLKTGYRMPRPDECPPEIFDTVITPCWNVTSKKRPDFKNICKQIRAFRSGGDTQEGYYAVDPKSRSYDNPKERTSEYTAGRKKQPGNEYIVQDELYDDTRR